MARLSSGPLKLCIRLSDQALKLLWEKSQHSCNGTDRTAYFHEIMPSAQTMLSHYQHQVQAKRGAGLAGLAEQAQLGGAIRALIDVVNDDHDPRRA